MARVLKEYSSVVLKPEDLDGKTDFAKIFGRCSPIHIEIGTGKATFLLNQALAKPDVNFLGIERARKYCRYAIDRIGRRGLTNVRVIRTDAADFLAGFVPDSSVECFHIYFPDPWPKKRHHKRRFFKSANIENLLRCLTRGGSIKVATDHAEYFQQIQKLLTSQSDRLERIEFFPTAGADTGEWVGSNFEKKYIKENRPIFCLAVAKK